MMRWIGVFQIALLLFPAIMGTEANVEVDMTATNQQQPPIRVHLIGASVGEAWDFPRLPVRQDLEGYLCEYSGVYEFDKSGLLKASLSRAEEKPDIIILKECAAYFPGPLEEYKDHMREWIDECLQAGVTPLPATIAPVISPDPPGSFEIKLKRFIKHRIFGKPIRGEQLVEYNDWLKEYTVELGLGLLDLEAALRVSEYDRCLRPDFDGGDGLHLNDNAYKVLDMEVIRVLQNVIEQTISNEVHVTAQ